MEIRLPVPQILQKPELPNGCEITSCTQVLRFLGFPADKCEMADRYLPRSERWYGADPDLVYMGNPHRSDDSPECGYYCFAGPIVRAANAYLKEQGSSLAAIDLTGCGEEALRAQLKKGNPVIFWASLHFQDIQFDPAGSYPLPDGREHRIFHQLHCMVLSGMDEDRYFITDPLDYNSSVPRRTFMKIFRQLGSRAVVIV